MNNASTRFILSSARARASKYAVFLIVLGTSFFWNPTANASNVWQTVNGNVVGNTVQFDWRGGSATYVTDAADGSTVSVTVNNTIANCIGSCTPIPDEWTVSINGQTFSGNTIEVITVGTQVSGQVTVVVTGRDIGFWGGWYGPVFSAPVIASPTPAPEPEPSPSPSVSESPTVVVDSPTVVVSDTSVAIVETPTVLETVTSESSTQTNQLETSTNIVTPSEPTPSPSEPSLPSPPPAVEPEPTPAPAPAPAPQPEPQPEPAPIPVEEPPAPAEEPPVVEEQPPVEEPPAPAVEEEPPLPPVEEEQPAPTPEPLPEPVEELEPTSQPDIASEPQSINNVDLESLAPNTPVQLDNGVVVTAEVAIAVALLQDPAALLQELFTDPGAALAAFGSVGADLSPEVRETAEEVVVSAIIAGGIATQSAAAAAATAAYRRKP